MQIPTLREFFAQRGLVLREMRDTDGNIVDPDRLRYRGEFVEGKDGKLVEVKDGWLVTQD